MSFRLSPEINLQQRESITPISNIFIDYCLPIAPSAYIAVFLFGFRQCSGGRTDMGSHQVAEALNMLESDVIKAWLFWQELELLTYNEEKDEVYFLPIRLSGGGRGKKAKSMPAGENSLYSPSDMQLYTKNDPTVRELASFAEKHLGRMLSQSDTSTLLYLYDTLGMSPELIKILLEYCTGGGHRNMRYIETVGMDWHALGLLTPEQASEHIRLYQKDYMSIMRSFGQNRRTPTDIEAGFMKRWLSEMHFPVTLIQKACERTVLSLGRPSFQYANSILESWLKNNVKTEDDVVALDKAYGEAKKMKEGSKAAEKQEPGKQNKFANFEQRNWDFKKLEQLEREARQIKQPPTSKPPTSVTENAKTKKPQN